MNPNNTVVRTWKEEVKYSYPKEMQNCECDMCIWAEEEMVRGESV